MDALLFMKENSQRLPNKNVKVFCGKPLFCHIIETLLKVDGINKIYIDTDSQKIATSINAYLCNNRIIIMSRPKHLIGNHITANSLIKGMLDRIEGDDFLQTHVTNPLLTVTSINEAINLYKSSDNDSLFAVTKHSSPFYSNEGIPINHDPQIIEQSQNATAIYEDNSNLYIFSRKSFNKFGRIGNNPIMFVTSKIESIDINTKEDWKLAKALKLKGSNYYVE